jgi:hypothetical protein
MPRGLQIGAKTCGGLWVNRERISPATLAGDAQRIEAAVLVQVADLERRDLGAPQSDLQTDRQDRAISQTGDGIFGGQVEQFARLRFREGQGRAFIAIDRRPLNLADRIARGVVMTDQVLIQRGQGREPSADCRRRGVLDLAHVPLPGDHRFVVGLAQLLRYRDAERAHEVLHVEPVGTTGAGTFLLREPDFLFGDLGKLGDGGNTAGASATTGKVLLSSIICAPRVSPFLSSRFVPWQGQRDKPDYHVEKRVLGPPETARLSPLTPTLFALST